MALPARCRIRSTGSPSSGSRPWRSDPRPIRLGWPARCESMLRAGQGAGQARGARRRRGSRGSGLAGADAAGSDRAVGRSSRPTARRSIDGLVDAIEVDLESVFQQALAGDDEPDSDVLAYADHLRFRRQRDRCLEVIDQALRSRRRHRGERRPKS